MNLAMPVSTKSLHKLSMCPNEKRALFAQHVDDGIGVGI